MSSIQNLIRGLITSSLLGATILACGGVEELGTTENAATAQCIVKNGIKICDDGSSAQDSGSNCVFQNGVKKCSGAAPGGSGVCIVKKGIKICDDGSGTPPAPGCVYQNGVKKCSDGTVAPGK